jgi:hypothetical protein
MRARAPDRHLPNSGGATR